MSTPFRTTVIFAALAAFATSAFPLDRVRVEIRSDAARAKYGVTGKGVVVAIVDRGVDVRSADLRNADGTSRILWLYDLTDERGAHASNNPYGIGTLYSKEQIDAALAANQNLPAGQDATGHGTPLAGIAAGNGANDPKYRGIAPEASLIIVKAVTEGAGEHNDIPAELPYSNPSRIPAAIDFVIEKLQALKKPGVLVLFNDAQKGPTDGSSALARKIDSVTGAGIRGFAIVTGSGDEGTQKNRAAGTLVIGRTARLKFHKGKSGPLNIEIWYSSRDRVDTSLISPSGAVVNLPSFSANGTSATFSNADVTYTQYSSGKDPYATNVAKRLISLRIDGALGDYALDLAATAVNSDGRFDATMNPSALWNPSSGNAFTSLVAPGSLWDGASARNGIVVSSYVIRAVWTDLFFQFHHIGAEGEEGDIWRGSSAGPTFDGRPGVDVSAPSDRIIAPYAPSSVLATFGYNLIDDGKGKYGITGGTESAAAVSAGVIALMLEVNPSLDGAEIKSILQKSARQDVRMGATPNFTWGYGKIDALAAVEASRLPEPQVPAAPARRRAVRR